MAKEKKQKYQTYQDKEYERNYELEQQRKKELKQQAEQDYLALLEKQTFFKKLKNDYKNSISEFKQKKVATSDLKQYVKEAKQIIDQYQKEIDADVLVYLTKYEKSTFKFKKWFYGIGKEIRRTSWTSKKSLLLSFVVVIVIVVLLAAIFFGIDSAFYSLSTK